MPVGKPFPKGKSGNPGGRPKKIAETLAKYQGDGDGMMAALKEIASDPANDGRTRVGAIKEFLDRLWGKPQQSVDITGNAFPTSITVTTPLTRAAAKPA